MPRNISTSPAHSSRKIPADPKSLLLIQTGTPPQGIRTKHGDVPKWFCDALECSDTVVDVVRVFEKEVLPPPGSHRAAIIAGSWAMVADRLAWSETTAQWIRDAMAIEMPLFGVSYGHQLMAHALGGRVAYNPAGLEIGCLDIELLPTAMTDPLLQNQPPSFRAHLTHLQTVLELPAGAIALARSSIDPHQMVRYGRSAVSTQFHPELTPRISAACLARRIELLRSKGQDPKALQNALDETPYANELLRQFVRTYSAETFETAYS